MSITPQFSINPYGSSGGYTFSKVFSLSRKILLNTLLAVLSKYIPLISAICFIEFIFMDENYGCFFEILWNWFFLQHKVEKIHRQEFHQVVATFCSLNTLSHFAPPLLSVNHPDFCLSFFNKISICCLAAVCNILSISFLRRPF